MKKLIFTLFIIGPLISFAQLGVAFHQSNLPFVAINYQVTNKIRPELRIGTDNYFELIAVEAVVMYDLVKKEEYDFYAGLGLRTNDFTGLVIPIGLNVYPFTVRKFGFHIELSPMIREPGLLRGSWGIRYKFDKKK